MRRDARDVDDRIAMRGYRLAPERRRKARAVGYAAVVVGLRARIRARFVMPHSDACLLVTTLVAAGVMSVCAVVRCARHAGVCGMRSLLR